MKNKADRLQAIKEIIINTRVSSQDDLLKILISRGFKLTQATLSRDLKQLQIAKIPNTDGGYIYVMPGTGGIGKIIQSKINSTYQVSTSGFISIEFSGQIAIIKTRPGYANGIAYDIDTNSPHEILGTIAGDDTIMCAIRDAHDTENVKKHLESFII